MRLKAENGHFTTCMCIIAKVFSEVTKPQIDEVFFIYL
jgi:hypothetical protein